MTSSLKALCAEVLQAAENAATINCNCPTPVCVLTCEKGAARHKLICLKLDHAETLAQALLDKMAEIERKDAALRKIFEQPCYGEHGMGSYRIARDFGEGERMKLFKIARISCRAGTNLREERLNRGIPLKVVAEKSGISSVYLSEIERSTITNKTCSEEVARKIEQVIMSSERGNG